MRAYAPPDKWLMFFSSLIGEFGLLSTIQRASELIMARTSHSNSIRSGSLSSSRIQGRSLFGLSMYPVPVRDPSSFTYSMIFSSSCLSCRRRMRNRDGHSHPGFLS